MLEMMGHMEVLFFVDFSLAIKCGDCRVVFNKGCPIFCFFTSF